MIGLDEDGVPVAEAVDRVRRPEAGAIVAFVGTVRAEDGLEALHLEAYEEMARERLAAVRDAALSRFDVLEVAGVHRVGRMGVGEDIVVIAVSAAHRDDAFRACRFMIDELKATVPIWKKEVGPDRWVRGAPIRDVVSVHGDARTTGGMVDVSGKEVVPREAVASGSIRLSAASLDAITSGTVRKGDVLEVARVAAMLAVKRTPETIPHCHPVPVTSVDLGFRALDDRIEATCTVRADYRTGVEMEALSGVTTALLTVWDMVKYLEKDGDGQYPETLLGDVRVVRKTKGGGE